MQHIAISDHGVMYGVLDWYRAARANDLSPVIGVEAYLAPGGIDARTREIYHLLLLAENERGYRNLLKLKGQHRGFLLPPTHRSRPSQRTAGWLDLYICLPGWSGGEQLS